MTILTACAALYGQSDGEYGTSMNLSYGVGARALGMGRAYTAMVNDPTAVFWNPAGLERVPRMSFSLFHNQLFEGTNYDFAGFVYPTLTYGTAGIGYSRIGTGDIPAVSGDNVYLGQMSYEESELYFSYAKRLPLRLIGGATVKVRRQQFSFINQSATGLGVDLGLMYFPGWQGGLLQNIGFGLNYRNLVSPELKLGSENEQEPYHLALGLTKSFLIGTAGRMNLVFDYLQTPDQSGGLHAGTEYVFRDMGTVRLGFDNSTFSFGAGISYSIVDIDYALGSNISDSEFPPTHRFSLTFNLGKTRSELVEIAEEQRRKREKELVERTKEEERQAFIDEHLEKGNEYLTDKRYFDAYVEFQQVVSVDPFNQQANALMDSANNQIQQDLEERQQEMISQAIDKEMAEENSRFVKLHFEKGQLFLQKNQFTDAMIEFNLALERAPNDPTITEAIATAERRLEQQVRRLVGQGRDQFQQGNYSNAIRILSEALVLAPEDPALKQEINTLANRIKIQQYIQEALQLYDIGNFEQALALFEEALKMDPSNERLRQYIERARRGIGGEEKVMTQEDKRRYLNGMDLFLANKYEEALKIWRELETKYPYNKQLQDVLKGAEDRLKQSRGQ
ncbi:MAG: PorV/PorQ family protein [Calditrichia bacterium]